MNTVAKTDAGFFGVDVKKNAFIADFRLGGQANQTTDVGIGGASGSRSFRRHGC